MSQSNSQSTPLIIDDHDRYARLELISWWEQARIRNAKVLVVGAGALGNEVLKNLALLGWGTIYMIDFDSIQGSNLSRSVLFRAHHAGQAKAAVAAEAVVDLNPDCQVFYQNGNIQFDVGLGLIDDVDLVICCVDNREARLWINRMCWKVSTPWIDGGIQEINGVAKVFQPPAGACYECAMTENDYRLISLRYSCPLLRQEDIQQGRTPTAPTIASMIGGLQVQEALKLIHQLPTSSGVAWIFNGTANKFYETQFTRREACLSHEHYPSVVTTPLRSDNTVAELFGWIEQQFGLPASSLTLVLDRDFLVELQGIDQQTSKRIERPMQLVDPSEGVCAQTGQPLLPRTICQIDATSEYLDRRLCWLGVPAWDIVKVTVAENVVGAEEVKSQLDRVHAPTELFLKLAGDQDSDGVTGWTKVSPGRGGRTADTNRSEASTESAPATTSGSVQRMRGDHDGD